MRQHGQVLNKSSGEGGGTGTENSRDINGHVGEAENTSKVGKTLETRKNTSSMVIRVDSFAGASVEPTDHSQPACIRLVALHIHIAQQSTLKIDSYFNHR